MFDKMKQVYEMQKKAKEIQKKLEGVTAEQSEDGVKLKINGVFKVESLEIDSALMTPEHKQKLESLLCRLFSDAVKDIQKKSAAQSQDLLKGFSF